jgi:hypothetical protein
MDGGGGQGQLSFRLDASRHRPNPPPLSFLQKYLSEATATIPSTLDFEQENHARHQWSRRWSSDADQAGRDRIETSRGLIQE